MTRIFVAVIILALSTATPSFAQQAPKPGDTVFLFGKTRYFHTLVRKRHCDAVDKAAYDAANTRYEAVRRRLGALYGEKFFTPDVPDANAIPEARAMR